MKASAGRCLLLGSAAKIWPEIGKTVNCLFESLGTDLARNEDGRTVRITARSNRTLEALAQTNACYPLSIEKFDSRHHEPALAPFICKKKLKMFGQIKCPLDSPKSFGKKQAMPCREFGPNFIEIASSPLASYECQASD